MSRVFLDSNIFIYLIEDEGVAGRKARELVERLEERHDSIFTSTLTLGEVLIVPLRTGNVRMAELYEQKLDTPGVHILDFDRKAARHFARIRADRAIKAPDAMQLAMAAAARCDVFVTNDDRLSRKVVEGIQFIVGFGRMPF